MGNEYVTLFWIKQRMDESAIHRIEESLKNGNLQCFCRKKPMNFNERWVQATGCSENEAQEILDYETSVKVEDLIEKGFDVSLLAIGGVHDA